MIIAFLSDSTPMSFSNSLTFCISETSAPRVDVEEAKHLKFGIVFDLKKKLCDCKTARRITFFIFVKSGQLKMRFVRRQLTQRRQARVQENTIFLFLKSKVITLHDAHVGGTVPFIIL